MFARPVYSEETKTPGKLKSKQNESIGKFPSNITGFSIHNAQGKIVQSIGSKDVKIIEGITTMHEKHKESYAFKDKKQLRTELENFFVDDE